MTERRKKYKKLIHYTPNQENYLKFVDMVDSVVEPELIDHSEWTPYTYITTRLMSIAEDLEDIVERERKFLTDNVMYDEVKSELVVRVAKEANDIKRLAEKYSKINISKLESA